MTLRAALYARYSTELQSQASIPDQFRACRRLAAQLGAEVVGEYQDAAISGASIAGRPGLLALLSAARAGGFDVVLCEALDRLSRDGGHAWDIFYELRDGCGVAIHTLAEGRAEPLHIGLKGTMNALYREETGRKTRRGMEGVLRAGRHAGQLPYGYRTIRRLGDDGELVRGLIEIDPERAETVRGIFRDYAAGISPQAIADALNAAGAPTARGAAWTAQTVYGDRRRGYGMLNNRAYVGELVWGRTTRPKDRRTGKRLNRPTPAEAVVAVERPDLRIVGDELWAAVKARQAAMGRGAQPHRARRPVRLLSGLVLCGCNGCGQGMLVNVVHGRAYYACRARGRAAGVHVRGASRTPRAEALEARVLEAVRTQLLHPAVIEAAAREYRAEKARRAHGAAGARVALAKALAETVRREARLVEALEQGAGLAAVKARLAELQGRRAAQEAELAALGEESRVVPMHPDAPGKYRDLVEGLLQALDAPAGAGADDAAAADHPARQAEARERIRAVIAAVHVIPEPAAGAWRLEIESDLAPIVTGADRWVESRQACASQSPAQRLPVRIRA